MNMSAFDKLRYLDVIAYRCLRDKEDRIISLLPAFDSDSATPFMNVFTKMERELRAFVRAKNTII